MAATLSSFIPPIFRTNHQQSDRYDADFSYSYSELPVFRSKFEHAKDGGDQRPKSTCGVVSGNLISPKRSVAVGDTDIYTKQYEERKAVSLPYQHIDQHVSLPRVKCGRSNLPPNLNLEHSNKANEVLPANKLPLKFKIIPDKGKQYSDDLKSGNSVKCEETRKRFELQTTCTNLPQKKLDKEKVDTQNANAIKLKKFEETKKAIELQSSCASNGGGNFPQKLLTKGNSWDSYISYDGKSQGKDRELSRREYDKRNFPPKSDSFDRKLDSKLKGNVSPKSLDFINDIGEYLNRSDCGSCDSSAGYSFSPSKSLDSGDNYHRSSDIKDPSTVASSVRRLRNSIFSSLKLPRKIGSKMNMNSQGPMLGTLGRDPRTTAAAVANANKRKSAVELLAESKAFYVKSETVLDRKQELPLRGSCPVSSTSGAHYATLSGRHRRAGGEPLQNQLRKLLSSTSISPNDSLHEPRVHGAYFPDKRKTARECFDWDIPPHQASAPRSHYNSGTFSANSSSGTSGSKGQVKSDPEHSRISSSGGPYSTKSLNRPSSSGDNRIFFPDSFVIPKPSRSDPANVFSKNYTISSAYTSPEKIDARKILSVVDAYDEPDMKMWNYEDPELLQDFSTISPPAEYAITERSNYRYVRSNSHSQTMKAVVQDNYTMNINSHKSLPDLHKQAEHYVEDGSRLSGASGSVVGANYLGVSCEMGATMRSNEALSSYSKATSGRSNRSSVFSKTSDGHSRRSLSCHNSDPSRGSAEDPYYYNRSGSSYARDSGGSSGHCSAGLGVIAPPPVQTSSQRRDSGSSTQHSSARSRHRYSMYYDPYSPHQLEAPPMFQDGAPSPPRQGPSPPHPPPHHHQHHVTPLHAPEPPLALNATLQICTNLGARSMHGATVTRVATGVEESGGQTLVGIHFQASIPPIQFQDSQPHGYASYGSLTSYGRRDSGSRESRHSSSNRPSSYGPSQPVYATIQPRSSTTTPVQATQAAQVTVVGSGRGVGEELQPPPTEDSTHSPPGVLGNFRRQRCLRYKQRRPVLRSKSDISDRYWRPDGKQSTVIDKQPTTPPSSTDNESPDRITRSQLDKFFNQLGMSDETYKEVILSSLKKPRSKDHQKNQVLVHSKNSTSPNIDFTNLNASPKAFVTPEDDTGVSSESPVFSDMSIADSNHITNNGDYTVQGPKETKPYRSCEPPSIVERNARIIKWLCNCRKLQTVGLP